MTTLYHLTSKVDFRLDPKKRPANNTTMGGSYQPGIFLTDQVEHWANGYGYWQPWVVQFDVPSDVMSAEGVEHGGYGNETFVPARYYDRLRIVTVMPIDAWCRQEFGDYGWIEDWAGVTFDGKPLEGTGYHRQQGYRWTGDARQWPREQQQAYAKQVAKFRRQRGRGAYASRTASMDWQRTPEGRSYLTSIVGKNGRTYYLKINNGGYDSISAYAEDPYEIVGRLHAWQSPFTGKWEIHQVAVNDGHQRQGIASAMLALARQGIPDLVHSDALSDDGKAWARAYASRTAARDEDFLSRLTYKIVGVEEGLRVQAIWVSEGERRVGMISWNARTGNIAWVQVYEERDQRRGVATEMLRRAREINPKVHHSDELSESGAAWAGAVASKIAMPSWRDRGDLPQVDCVIQPDVGRSRFNSYGVYTYGEMVARFPRLTQAKAYIEDIYGPQQWIKVPGDQVPKHDRVWGFTTEFNDAPYYLIVEHLPRLGATAGANGDLPEDIFFEARKGTEWGRVNAFVRTQDGGTREAGSLVWNAETGEIENVEVPSHYRRQGIATAMLAEARKIDPRVHHSEVLSDDAKAWKSKVATFFMHDADEPLIDTKPMEGFEDKASFDFVHPQIATGGALRFKSDMRILARRGVTGVVSGRRDFDDELLLEGQEHLGIRCLSLPVPDNGSSKPTSWFKAAIDFCLPILRSGSKVYIHCHAGMNRGPSLAYAVLRAYTGVDHDTALRTIKSARDVALVGYADDADRALVELGYAKDRADVDTGTFHTITGAKTATQGVKAWHGTSKRAWERLLSGQGKAESIRDLCSRVESDLGLKPDSIWNSKYLTSWSHSRVEEGTENALYLTLDRSTAIGYAQVGSAPLYDFLAVGYIKAHLGQGRVFKGLFGLEYGYRDANGKVVWDDTHRNNWLKEKIEHYGGGGVLLEFDIPPRDIALLTVEGDDARVRMLYDKRRSGQSITPVELHEIEEWAASRARQVKQDAELTVMPWAVKEVRKYLVSAHEVPVPDEIINRSQWDALNQADRDALEQVGPRLAGPAGGRIPQGVKARPPFGSDIRRPRQVKIDRKATEDIEDLEPDERDQVLAALRRLERGTDRTIEAKSRPPLVGCFSLDVTPVIRVMFYLHVDGCWHVFAVTPDHNYAEVERRMRNVASADVQILPMQNVGVAGFIFPGLSGVAAYDGQRKIGELVWSDDSGEITQVEVDAPYRRQGIATRMLQKAREYDSRVHHSTTLSQDGEAWSKRVAAPQYTRVFNGDGKAQYEYRRPRVYVAIDGVLGDEPTHPVADTEVEVPWLGDIEKTIREAERKAERAYSQEPYAKWIKDKGLTFYLMAEGGNNYVLATAKRLGDPWTPAREKAGYRPPWPEFLSILRSDPKHAWEQFCMVVGDAQPPSLNVHPLTMGKDVVTIYRGISLAEGMDPLTSDRGSGDGIGAGVGSSWTLDLGVAKAIAERGQAGFSNDNNVFGKPKTIKVFRENQRSRAVVLRAEVDLSQNASLLTDGRMYYATEQEVNLDFGTKFTMTGWMEAEQVVVNPSEKRKAEEQAKKDMAENGYSFADYDITYRWPSSWHTVRVQRTAAVQGGIPLRNIVKIKSQPDAYEAVVAPGAPLVYRNIGGRRELEAAVEFNAWSAAEGGFTVRDYEGDTQFTTSRAEALAWSHPLRKEDNGYWLLVTADITGQKVRFYGHTAPAYGEQPNLDLWGDDGTGVFYPNQGLGIGVVGEMDPARVIRRVETFRQEKDGGIPTNKNMSWSEYVAWVKRRWQSQDEVFAANNPGWRGAPRVAGANGDLPEGLIIRHGGPGDLPEVWPYGCKSGEYEVRAEIDGKPIGQVKWLTTVNPNANVTVGHIIFAGVQGEYQRRGIASEMLRRAREIDPRVHHSTNLTDMGRSWSQRAASAGFTLDPKVYRDQDANDYGDPIRVKFVRAVDAQGNGIGSLQWNADTGEIVLVHVSDPWRRKGVATALLEYARTKDPEVHHSETLSDDGREWAERVAADSADTDGVMVALVPPMDVCKALVAHEMATEPLENQHITLIYLGKKGDVSKEDLHEAVEAWAAESQPITGRVAGYGTFINEEGGVLYASWDLPGATGWREGLLGTLKVKDIDVTENHGWTPHQTLAYADEPIRELPPMPEGLPEEVIFGSVVVAYGGEWTAYALLGDPPDV